ncbi:MAG: type II toxin-antitoxin system PemK/MazF family toxin [Blastocatellales bacterium]
MKVERWSIWQVNLDPVVGSEQGKTRPAMIISQEKLNDILPVVNVLPLTTRKPGRRIYPNEALLPQGEANPTSDSLVLCYQIRTLDKQRFQKRIGLLVDQQIQEEILTALSFQLGL